MTMNIILMKIIWTLTCLTIVTRSDNTFGCYNQFCEARWMYNKELNYDSKECMRPWLDCTYEDTGVHRAIGCVKPTTPPIPDIYCTSTMYRDCKCAHNYTAREDPAEGVAYCNCTDVEPKGVLAKTSFWEDEDKFKDLVVTPIVVLVILGLLLALVKIVGDFYLKLSRQRKGN